jgi:RNA-binding protein YhbY
MAPSKRRVATPVDFGAVLPRVAEILRVEKVLNASGLSRNGIPKAQQPQAIDRLVERGFERSGKSGVRVKVRAQLLDLLSERGTVPLKGIARATRGAVQKEAKAAAEALAREGAALIAVRGKVEVLVASSTPALSRAEVQSLSNACKQLGKQSAAALRASVPKTLLREDVRALLLDLVANRSTTQPQSALVDLVMQELTRAVRKSVGLAFVPDAVRALVPKHPAESVQDALLQAARVGWIELQPESGVGRLSPEELALCPPGPEGTRLSWARILGERK